RRQQLCGEIREEADLREYRQRQKVRLEEQRQRWAARSGESPAETAVSSDVPCGGESPATVDINEQIQQQQNDRDRVEYYMRTTRREAVLDDSGSMEDTEGSPGGSHASWMSTAASVQDAPPVYFAVRFSTCRHCYNVHLQGLLVCTTCNYLMDYASIHHVQELNRRVLEYERQQGVQLEYTDRTKYTDEAHEK
ncbi:MAG: hypothetical protein GY772_15185, partial [bacterium]|nr:hypothetical protein [bacterium]